MINKNNLDKENATRRIDKLRIAILFEQTGVVQVGAVSIVAIYVFLFRNTASREFLLSWTCVFATLFVVRYAVARYFKHIHLKVGRDFSPTKWENIFCALAFCSGVVWCAAFCFSTPTLDVASLSLISYVMAGITAGAAVAYSASFRASYCFFAPVILPCAIKLILVGDEVHWGVGGMMLAYFLVLLQLTKKFNGYAVNSLSLTYQKEQLIGQIRMMQSQVTQTAQMTALGKMAGGLAHEINNPLAIISASLEQIGNLSDQPTPAANSGERIRKLLRSAEGASQRITKIIKDFRFFTGKPVDESSKTIPLRSLVESVIGFSQERFKNNQIDVAAKNISNDIFIDCKQYHMTQVFFNLLSNSFDAIASQSEKWIKIEAIDLGDIVEISVTDSGNGISEEIQTKLMQPFFTTKEVGKGVGLGLCSAKGIVNDHHGDLWLDTSSPNTRFVISLPKARTSILPQAS